MYPCKLLGFLLVFLCWGLHGAVVHKKDVVEIESQGLYNKNDKVVILGQVNFDQAIYNKPHAWLIEFYNSFCGHCRLFAPKFKEFASEIHNWKKVINVGVVDCSVEDNSDICRQFEVMQYPSLRYMHENYTKGNANIGERLEVTLIAEKLHSNLLEKLEDEQDKGRLQQAPSLIKGNYDTLTKGLQTVPNDVKYTFFIFETEESKVGSEVILDTHNYMGVVVKRVLSSSKLAHSEDINRSPALMAVHPNLEKVHLTPKNPTRASLVNAINMFLESRHIALPHRSESSTKDYYNVDLSLSNMQLDSNSDIVFLADLEATLKASLRTEIVRYKILKGEALQALLGYLAILINYFPFKANGREYLVELRGSISSRTEISGEELHDLVTRLEASHAPVYATRLNYIGCKGSEAQYRGYSCGLWTLFHTLTVAAASKRGGSAPDVLRGMHGYVKHFFGCTDCSQHFQTMADKNKIFDVRDNDKAVLWLWISHNEVNLRLAGDSTEDPKHPKIQFPSVDRCRSCRLEGGAWSLPHVYHYLATVYSGVQGDTSSHLPSASPLSPLDFGLLSMLYLLSFAILLVVIKLFWTKRFYSKKSYKHGGWGKV